MGCEYGYGSVGGGAAGGGGDGRRRWAVGKREGVAATQPDLAGDMAEPTGPLVIGGLIRGRVGSGLRGFLGCFNEIGWRACAG